MKGAAVSAAPFTGNQTGLNTSGRETFGPVVAVRAGEAHAGVVDQDAVAVT